MSAPIDPAWRRALVVFSGQADLWWLRLLRPGFRHCFVALEGAGGWVVVDPLSHRTCLAIVPICQEFDLKSWYDRQGMVVMETRVIATGEKVAPIRPYSCVESVKRILGIQAGMVVTPWQLYRHLNKTRKYVLTERLG